MLFPSSERVEFEKNPLVEVICQLRFPTILEIRTDIPSKFQKLIRSNYPIYDQEAGESRFPNEVSNFMGRIGIDLRQPGPHMFTSESKTRTITLTPEFVAITEKEYRRWETFRSEIDLMLKAFADVYEPPYFSRAGLRYQDKISREELGLMDQPWSTLIRGNGIGLLGVDFLEKHVAESETVVRLSLDSASGAQMRVRHGLVNVPEGEQIYLIDSDFFIDKRQEVKDVISGLDGLSRTAGRFFRWAITDKLRAALQPKPILD